LRQNERSGTGVKIGPEKGGTGMNCGLEKWGRTGCRNTKKWDRNEGGLSDRNKERRRSTWWNS
jgi:hypothetical protein